MYLNAVAKSKKRHCLQKKEIPTSDKNVHHKKDHEKNYKFKYTIPNFFMICGATAVHSNFRHKIFSVHITIFDKKMLCVF